MNPRWNRTHGSGHTFWKGALQDGRDRGCHHYYCPIGWKRHSFLVSDDFDDKFHGWSICYHGTKFQHGLSILLGELNPATAKDPGDGIHVTPSIINASHPRYSEVKEITPAAKEFFPEGDYIQFILECRVQSKNIRKISMETLGSTNPTIDPNVDKDVIEWVIDNRGRPVVDFNDPNSTTVCTGLMVRVTKNHPGLLPESEWWFQSHLCPKKENQHCLLAIDLEDLKKTKT